MNHPDVLHDKQMLEVTDEFGLRMRVPRSEYLEKVLPHNIQIHWDNPDLLASTINGALNDGAYFEVEQAAKHLLTIDNVKERAASLYGSVLLKTERYFEAENFFEDYLASNPRHPYVLTNYAKAKDHLGQSFETVKLLEESLKADPNQDNALTWWIIIKKEELQKQDLSIETAIIYAFEQAKIRFGGWRVKLLLGIEYLKQQDRDEAYNNFTDALQLGNTNYDEVVANLSSALGSNGFPQDIVDLIAPIYEPHADNLLTGVNLLQAYYELGEFAAGQKLLMNIYQVNAQHYAEQLAWYETEFAKALNTPEQQPEPRLVSTVTTIHYPMWCYGWNVKHGFTNSQTGKNIAILQFANAMDEGMLEVTADTDTQATKLARALPLSILEGLNYNSDLRSSVMLPICEDKGSSHIFYNKEPENQQIMELVNQGYSAAVTGTISADIVSISYWDVQRIAKYDAEFSLNRYSLSELPSLLTDFVASHAGATLSTDFKQDKRGFKEISSLYFADYLLLSAQHMTLKIANNFTKLHDLVRGMLKLAKDSQNIQIQLSMLSIIHLAVRQDYPEIREYHGVISKWLMSVANSKSSLSKMALQTANMFDNYC